MNWGMTKERLESKQKEPTRRRKESANDEEEEQVSKKGGSLSDWISRALGVLFYNECVCVTLTPSLMMSA